MISQAILVVVSNWSIAMCTSLRRCLGFLRADRGFMAASQLDLPISPINKDDHQSSSGPGDDPCISVATVPCQPSIRLPKFVESPGWTSHMEPLLRHQHGAKLVTERTLRPLNPVSPSFKWQSNQAISGLILGYPLTAPDSCQRLLCYAIWAPSWWINKSPWIHGAAIPQKSGTVVARSGNHVDGIGEIWFLWWNIVKSNDITLGTISSV